VPLEYVRESVTLLLQETLVFDGTIYENNRQIRQYHMRRGAR